MAAARTAKRARRFNARAMTDEEYELLIWAVNREQWDQWTFLCQSRNGSEAYWDMKMILENNRNRYTEQPPDYIGTTTGQK